MSAVRTCTSDQFDAAVEQQRGVSVLHKCGHRLGAVDQRTLIGIGQAQEHGGDIAGVHGRTQLQGKADASEIGGVVR